MMMNDDGAPTLHDDTRQADVT